MALLCDFAVKVKVTLWVGGKTFDEIVTVASYEDAEKTALARNPTAKVIARNPIP
jgi:hypothetical protein